MTDFSITHTNQEKSKRNSYQFKCRVCLETSTKLYPLQGPIPNCEEDICKMISYCVGEEVSTSIMNCHCHKFFIHFTINVPIHLVI